ncbi:hypothetical protein EK546_09535 [Salmonella enterica]|nr:hypothetical protein [Salmonella enterica]
MKKIVVLVAVLLTGCAYKQPAPFCTGFVKTMTATGEAHYGLRVEKARIKQVRTHPVELRTKFGWWDVSNFDLRYGDCKAKLEQYNFIIDQK